MYKQSIVEFEKCTSLQGIRREISQWNNREFSKFGLNFESPTFFVIGKKRDMDKLVNLLFGKIN